MANKDKKNKLQEIFKKYDIFKYQKEKIFDIFSIFNIVIIINVALISVSLGIIIGHLIFY